MGYIWDLGTGKMMYQLKGHEDCIHATCFTQSSTRVVTGAADCSVRLWDLNANTDANNDSGRNSVESLVKQSINGKSGDDLVMELRAVHVRLVEYPLPARQLVRGPAVAVVSRRGGGADRSQRRCAHFQQLPWRCFVDVR